MKQLPVVWHCETEFFGVPLPKTLSDWITAVPSGAKKDGRKHKKQKKERAYKVLDAVSTLSRVAWQDGDDGERVAAGLKKMFGG